MFPPTRVVELGRGHVFHLLGLLSSDGDMIPPTRVVEFGRGHVFHLLGLLSSEGDMYSTY